MMSRQIDSLADHLQRSRQDPEAFAAFYAATAPNLLRMLTRRVFDAETGLDLMAETMAQAFLARERFRGSTDGEARAWLYAIGARQVALYYRRLRVETKALKRLQLERPAPPDETEARLIEREALADIQHVLQDALAELSVEQREVVELRLVRNERYSAIAAQLGISEVAARARFSRATEILRKFVSQETITEAAS